MHTTYSEKCHFSFKISLLSYNYEVLTPDHSLRLRTSRNKTNEGSGQCCARLASYPCSNRRWIWRTNCKGLRVQTKCSCLQVSGLSSAATTCTRKNYTNSWQQHLAQRTGLGRKKQVILWGNQKHLGRGMSTYKFVLLGLNTEFKLEQEELVNKRDSWKNKSLQIGALIK